MPHEDGDAYAHVVATVSLGAGLCLDVLPKPTPEPESREDGKGNDEEEAEVGDKNEEPTRFHFTKSPIERDGLLNLPTRIFQEPRSLLITTGRAYCELMHGISSVEVDEDLNEETVANWVLLSEEGRAKVVEDGERNVRGTRVSLTYRDVVKVSKAASRVLGGGRFGTGRV